MKRKGIFIPPLAYAIIIILIIVLIATLSPPVKQTILDFLHVVFG